MIVYLARNRTNGKVYIGQTVYSLEARKMSHESDARRGTPYIFHQALRKYGPESFDWQVIDRAEGKEDLNTKEKYWIQFYKAMQRQFGYNQTEGGTGGVPSLEVRKKQSERMVGTVLPDQVRRKMSDSRKGKHPSSSTREKIASTLKGHSFSDESLARLSSSHKGQVPWNKGVPMAESARMKLAKRNAGHHVSEETRAKISSSLKKRAELGKLGKEK